MVDAMSIDVAPITQGPAPRLLSAEDVAELLGVPRTFVYALARRGDLPVVRVGERYVRFRAEALERWITAQEAPVRGRFA
jgi:excisionase family DNA binding protein